MNRMGRRHRPFFRINAVDKRTPRDGVVLEALGWYDPLATDKSKALSLKADRIKAWIDKGAQPSESVGDILAREGIIDADKWNAKRTKRIAPKMKRLSKEREAKEASAKAEAEAKAAEEAKAKAEAEAKAAEEAASKAEAESADQSADEASTESSGDES